MAVTHEDERLWTIKDVAAFLRLTPQHLYQSYRRMKIPYVVVGRSVRFLPSAVRRWAGNQKAN